MTSKMAVVVAWIVIPIAKTLIAGVLIVAGASKLFNRGGFLEAVRGYKLLPDAVVRVFSEAVPVIEILTGASLLISIVVMWNMIAWAGALAMGLFALFGTAIAMNLLRGRSDISCGCFGRSADVKLSWWLVGRACCYFGLSAITLPPLHQRAVGVSGVMDRISIMLISIAFVAFLWVGRTVWSSYSLRLES